MSKYHNRKVASGGILHDSRKEARRWEQLLLLERAGHITDLRRQVKYTLIPAQGETYERYSTTTGKRLKDGTRTLERECAYIADFVYKRDGELVVEDVKGYRDGTAYDVFVIKRKLMLYIHGIHVQTI